MLKRSVMAITIAFLVVLAMAAALSGSVTNGIPWADGLRVVAGVTAIAALLWIVFRTNDISPPQGLGRAPQPIAPTKDEVAAAYFNVVNTYNSHALKMLVNLMIDRPHYLERINEVVELEEERPQLLVTTSQVFRISMPTSPLGSGQKVISSHGNDKVMLLPLALIEKGTLLDGFAVTDANGSSVPSLSYNQTRGLLAYVIRTIVEIAPESSHAHSNKDCKKIKSSVSARLVRAVCTPGTRKRKSNSERAEIEALLDSVNELSVPADWKQRIRRFCDALVDHYFIVAEVVAPAGGYVLVTYSQAISVDSSAYGLINRLRSRLGLRQSKFDIPLNIFGLEVDAYHMQMNASPMQYVFDHHLERMNSGHRVTQDDLCRGQDKPYVRLHYSTAGPAIHLYIRRQSGKRERNPAFQGDPPRHETRSLGSQERLKSVVEFREIPPGALGAATIISLIASTVIIFFALTRIGQMPFSGNIAPNSGSDIPALILALPGFASVIVGSWLDLSHLRRASLATYVGLGASVALSLASALYFLFDANKSIPGRISLHVTNGVTLRTDIGWLCLAATAITCTLFLMRDLTARSRYYFNLIEKRIERRAQEDCEE